MTGPNRVHPATRRMERIASVIQAEDLERFKPESREGICVSCPNPAPEIRPRVAFRLGHTPEWRRTECAMCEAERFASREREERARRCETALFNLNVPPLYADASLDTFILHGSPIDMQVQRQALKFAGEYVASFEEGGAPPVAVFLGSPGTGKGHLVWSIAQAIAGQQGKSVLVAVLSDVIRDLREAWNRSDDDGPSEATRLRRYRGVDLLVIDEVSRHSFFGQPQQHLYDLIAAREVQLRPTIITTNESGDKLADVLGPALASRAVGWDACIDFGDADYRLARRAMQREHLTQRSA